MKGFCSCCVPLFLPKEIGILRDRATPRLCLVPKPEIPLQPCKRLVYLTTLESPHQSAVQSPESAGAVRLSSHFQGAGSFKNNFFLLVSQRDYDTSIISNLQHSCPQLNPFPPRKHIFRTWRISLPGIPRTNCTRTIRTGSISSKPGSWDADELFSTLWN